MAKRHKPKPFKHYDPQLIDDEDEYDEGEGESYDEEDKVNWINKQLNTNVKLKSTDTTGQQVGSK